MSQDLGAVAAGFNKNFAYGTLVLSSNSHVKLVDLSDNASGTGAEAVYVQSLFVPSGCNLDLNGLHLYVRALQVAGTVLNGIITQLPDTGVLIFDTPTPGSLSSQGQTSEWTFYERAGRVVTVTVNPGSGGSPAPISPQLQWANVQLLDSSNNVLASATNTTAGTPVTVSQITIPEDGTYKIHVSAPAGHDSAT